MSIRTDEQILLDMVIIGAGPAGMAAALSAWENGCRNMLVLERDNDTGGILQQCIHNGFGLHYFKEELTGPEYAHKFAQKIKSTDIPVRCNTMVISLTTDKKSGLHTITAVSPEYGLCLIQAKTVILAMGCRERPRGAIGIPGSRCAGIMTTGTAQRLVNRDGLMPGKKIIILGSGDIGLIMARRLTFEGAQVLACIELMPFSSGLTRNVVQCLHDFNIPLMLNHTVIDIEGKERVTHVTIAQVDPETKKPLQQTKKRIECDTLLLSVGLIPENELSRQAGVKIDAITQGPIVDQNLHTTVPGIFACGNVLHVHDLVDFVSEESELAGKNAWRYCCDFLPDKKSYTLSENFSDQIVYVAVHAGQGVRGLVPQCLTANFHSQDIKISFRPDKVYKNARVKMYFNKQLIKIQNKQILTPGEMVTIVMKKEKLSDIQFEESNILFIAIEGE